MTYLVNGWPSIESVVTQLETGDNTPASAAYLQLIPVEDHNRIIGFGAPPMLDGQWIMEIANADPTQTLSIDLVGGLPGQDPAQIVLPPGFSYLRLSAGYTQRLFFDMGTGWVPLVPGALVP